MKAQYLLPAFFLLSACFVGELPPDMDNRIQFYYDGEDSVQLTLIPGKYFLLVERGIDSEELAEALFLPPSQISPIQASSVSGVEAVHDFHWTSASGAGPEADWDHEHLLYRAPYFFAEGGTELGLTHLFTVTLKAENDLAKLEELADEYQVELVDKSRDQPLECWLRCTATTEGNALEISRVFHESGYFTGSRPKFMDQNQLF